MFDIKSTDLVGQRVRVVRRYDGELRYPGVVRAITIDHGSFVLLIEAEMEAPGLGIRVNGLVQCWLSDENEEILIEHG